MGGCSDLNEADVAATGGRVSAAVADPAQSAADVAGNRSVDAGVLAITWSSTVTRRYNWSGLSQGLPNAQQIQIIHTAGPAGISLCEPPVPCTEKNCSDQRDLKRRNSEKKHQDANRNRIFQQKKLNTNITSCLLTSTSRSNTAHKTEMYAARASLTILARTCEKSQINFLILG